MRINGMLALAAGLVLLVASAAQAADIAATIQARYEKLRTFSATFEQTLTHKESGSVEKRQGNLLFQKPLLIRWQTDKPHEETLVVTHKEIWDYLADEEIAYRYPLELVRDSRTIIQVITKDFDVKEAGQENGLAKLHLYPKEPAPQMVEALLWVEPSTGYIRRASIIDFYGNSNDVRFTQFKPDTSLKESDFTFTAPKGVEVEDRIDRKVQEKELFK